MSETDSPCLAARFFHLTVRTHRVQGSFDVVFDWLRKVRSSDGTSIRYIFNTYFFRGPRYWMYENRFNRTRYGDPLYVSREWTGLPTKIDAYVQIITSSGSAASGSRPPEYLIETYFFSGRFFFWCLAVWRCHVITAEVSNISRIAKHISFGNTRFVESIESSIRR